MDRRIVTSSLALACASLMLLSACTKASTSPYGATSAPAAPNQPNTVVIANIAFGPASITVPVGTTITWQNNDGIAHTSTSDTGVWDTGAIAPGASKTTTFNAAGNIPVSLHGPFHDDRDCDSEVAAPEFIQIRAGLDHHKTGAST